jgi:endonuclease/exonuclease/phosphatase family metal-dependent hydrolase
MLHLSGLPAVATPAAPIKVMTYNVLYDDTNFRNTQIWHTRKKDVARVMGSADIIGTQEPLFSQVQYLKSALPGYDVIGVGNQDGKKKGLFCAIFYRTDTFRVLKSGTFWLSPQPDQPGSRGWDAQSLRIVTWAQFKDVAHGHVFFVFNTHFDHRSKRARVESARLLLDRIDTIAENASVLVVGDFNTQTGTSAYRILTQNGHSPLRNAYDLTDVSKRQGPPWTFVKKFKQGGKGKRWIDFILARGPRLHFEQHTIIDQKAAYGGYPSDHLPVMATFTILPHEAE